MAKSNDPRIAYIEIAARKFAQSGYHGTSLSALAKDAGVSKQALLHFFATKERLYAAVLNALAARLMDDINAVRHPDPAEHLLTYFRRFQRAALDRPDDIRLVVRALLDSDPNARVWPLKPYLDALAQIAAQTPGGQGASKDDIMVWLSQILGMIQYVAISAPTMRGMYGNRTAEHLDSALGGAIMQAVDRFTGRGLPH